jgi:hypothetical protein
VALHQHRWRRVRGRNEAEGVSYACPCGALKSERVDEDGFHVIEVSVPTKTPAPHRPGRRKAVHTRARLAASAMTEGRFWRLIETAGRERGFGSKAQVRALERRLAGLRPSEILGFERIFERQDSRANTWELWGAAYVIRGGCSDDSFMDFRYWLIARGKKVFEQALASPESLVDVVGRGKPQLEDMRSVAACAYELATGEEMPEVDDGRASSGTTGKEWREPAPGEGGGELPGLYPRLWNRYRRRHGT